jgi:predicted RNase H-like HicB family nuclease
MTLQRSVKAFVRKEDTHYVAECIDIAVVTQGKTLDETLNNLREAVALHLDGENLAELGFASDPNILVTMEIDPVHA